MRPAIVNDRLASALLKWTVPFERWHAWRVAVGHRKGKFKRPPDPALYGRRKPNDFGRAAVTTVGQRRPEARKDAA